MGGKTFKRTDMTLENKRYQLLHCSHYEPISSERRHAKLPCVVYLHGNCSSRTEAVDILSVLLPLQITVFSFDMTGCGKSQGKYISLGFYEKDDLSAVIHYLRNTNSVSVLGLWGRSMGAVTSILYAQRDCSIGAMVLDSPFADLKVLCAELSKKFVSLPAFIMSIGMKLINRSIRNRAGFNISDVSPIKCVGKCFVPALFCYGTNDDFIHPHHSKDLYQAYAGDANILFAEGDHNSNRPKFLLDSIGIFFYNTLQCENLKYNMEDEPKINKNNIEYPNKILRKMDINSPPPKKEEFKKVEDSNVAHNTNEKNKGEIHSIQSKIDLCSKENDIFLLGDAIQKLNTMKSLSTQFQEINVKTIEK